MMPLPRFEIYQPDDITDASKTLVRLGDEACVYGGGTELLLAMKQDVLRFEYLVDVKVIPKLDKIELQDGVLRIGATATHRSIETSDLVSRHLPVLAEMERRVANIRVRNTGTIGGNLCFAEPHSDPATLLLALEARVVSSGPEGVRTQAISDLLIGAYETSLGPGEILIRIEVPLMKSGERAVYSKFQIHERPTLGLALVSQFSGEGTNIIENCRVAIGCVAAYPRRSKKAEEMLKGRRAEVETRLSDAANALADEAELVDDIEGGADYKRHLIGVLLRRSFNKILET